MARNRNYDLAGSRPDVGGRPRPGLIAASALGLALSLVTGFTALPAGAKPTTTTTKSHGTTTTTAAVHTPSQADKWLLKAIGAEAKIGSVRIDGKIQ